MKRIVPASALVLLTLCGPAQAGMLLSEALSRAAERDPALAAAYASRKADDEAGVQERAGLKPSVSLKGQYDYANTDATFAFSVPSQESYGAWTAELQARQPLLRFDWFARLDRAEAQDALAAVNQRDGEVQFITRVCERYLNALLAQDQLQQAQAEVQSVRESLQDTQKRYDVELVPGTDLKEARARDDLTQAQLLTARASVEETRDALEEITGYDRSDLPQLKEQLVLPPMGPTDIDAWIKLAEDSNVTLAAAKLNAKIAENDVSSRRADGLPELDLVGTVSRADSRDYTLGSRQEDQRIGVELTIPIYAGGQNLSRKREAEARFDVSKLDLARVRLETQRSIRKSVRDVETARSADAAYTQALESSIAAEAAVRAGYDAGTRTIADVLDAKRAIVQARRERNQARYDLLTKILLLRANSGTLTVPDVTVLDTLFEQR